MNTNKPNRDVAMTTYLEEFNVFCLCFELMLYPMRSTQRSKQKSVVNTPRSQSKTQKGDQYGIMVVITMSSYIVLLMYSTAMRY